MRVYRAAAPACLPSWSPRAQRLGQYFPSIRAGASSERERERDVVVYSTIYMSQAEKDGGLAHVSREAECYKLRMHDTAR